MGLFYPPQAQIPTIPISCCITPVGSVYGNYVQCEVTMRATADFVLDTFDNEPPYDPRDGVPLARAYIQKTFTGEIEAESTVEMLSARPDTGGAGYVAIERISGTVDGREGSFVLLHIGTMGGGEQWAKWPIVPGSGTGELEGIRGEGKIDIDEDGGHHFTLDYEFGE